ncbi:hypothetical protein [Mycolicibacterium helvum]|uniref:Uncharacterized protein n=1 Tax=Mycolicibacterium helvum TaxID=1534349 RepID=A0A7I7T342_9MYCO|nr:hypothetical protein [Mycolicibacterium helvum]BBY63488.1 hypothetical protein MHEL_17310 [Mycolicibacterium helvum]
MSLSHDEFNEQVFNFTNDVERAITALADENWSIDAELASENSDRLRAVVDAKVQLCEPVRRDARLAELVVVYKLCVDSFSRYIAVEHSSFMLKAVLDRTPIIRWDYDRSPNNKPSSHMQITAHRGALSHLLSRLDHPTPHSIESLHLPMGGDRFRPCLEDIVEFLIRDCGFDGQKGWKTTVKDGRAKWRRIQARAAVRDAPGEAAAALEDLGFTVIPPADGAPDERIDKLTGW